MRRRRPFGVVLFVALVAAACTSGGDADDALTPSTVAETGSTIVGDDVVVEADALAAEVFRIAVPRPRSIDPAAVSPTSLFDLVIVDLLYDTLTTMDGTVAAPGLATFAASADLRTWRFTLTGDPTFASGRAITADDLVYSIDRVRSGGNASLAAVRLSHVDSVKAVSAEAVEITLDEPSSVFAELVSSPVYAIVDREAIEAALDGGDQTPNASGDFTAALGEGRLLLLRRSGAGVGSIVVAFADDDAAAYEQVVSGDADWAPVPPDRVGDADSAGILATVPSAATLSIGMQTTVGPLADERLRFAIAKAVDRTAVIDSAIGPGALPSHALVPEGIAGGDNACFAICSFDPDAAEAVIAAVFEPGPDPIDLFAEATPLTEAVASVLADQFAAVGLPVNVIPVAPEAYSQLVIASSPDLFLFGSVGVSRSPEPFLTDPFRTGDEVNLTQFSDPGVELLIASAMTDTHPGERARRWDLLQQTILQAAPVVPLIQFSFLTAVNADVRDLAIAVDGTVDWDVLRVERTGGK